MTVRRLLLPLLACCLLHSGCARRGGEKRFLAFSDALAAREEGGTEAALQYRDGDHPTTQPPNYQT